MTIRCSPLWYSVRWFYLGYFRDLVNFKRGVFSASISEAFLAESFYFHRILPPLFANAVIYLVLHTAAHRFPVPDTPLLLWRVAFLTAILFPANPWFWCSSPCLGSRYGRRYNNCCWAWPAGRGRGDTFARTAPYASRHEPGNFAFIVLPSLVGLLPLALLHYAGMVWRLPGSPEANPHSASRRAARMRVGFRGARRTHTMPA